MRFRKAVGPHITPVKRSVVVEQGVASLDFRYTVGDPAGYIFNVDIYAYEEHAHPDRHLGWWRFVLPPEHHYGTLMMDFGEVRADSMRLKVVDAEVPATESWHNPDYAFDPLADLELVRRASDGAPFRSEPILLKFVDRDILRKFYVRQYATDGYASAAESPFLPELHQYKMGRLRDLFTRHIPSGRALDIGCGRSLFADLNVSFPFKVYSGDLNYESVHARAVEVPHQAWGVFDAAAVPFQDGQFDAVFAGEVIEHVIDVRQTLREWWRVLKLGGVAISTTPNKERLVAVADGVERPYSRDHLSELSYRELTRDLLPSCGFEFVEQSCLYLELCLQNLFNGDRVQDFLQWDGNRSEYVPWMRRLFPLGRLAPWWSMGLIVVARKRSETSPPV